MNSTGEVRVADARLPAAAQLPASQRLALLTEWREALVKIVEDDPTALETRKTISAIDAEIAALSPL